MIVNAGVDYDFEIEADKIVRTADELMNEMIGKMKEHLNPTDQESVDNDDSQVKRANPDNGRCLNRHEKEHSLMRADIMPRMEEKRIKQMSPAALSFVGDSVFELCVRMLVLEKGSRTADKLNREKVKIVNAKAQARLVLEIEDLLTEEEHDIYRRGKNARQHSFAKNQSMADYHKASGLEAVLGYLYLKGEDERIRQLLQAGISQ